MGRQLSAAHGRRALLLTFLLVLACTTNSIAVKSGGGSGGGGRSSSSGSHSSASASGGRTYVYRSSYGVRYRTAIVAAAVLTVVYFQGYTYPAVRFHYTNDGTGTYDDCALRNLTASQLGGSDVPVNIDAVNAQLPSMLPATGSTSSEDIYAFNQTLYTQTNGLVVDPLYCNYTSAASGGGGSASAARMPAAIVLALAGAAAAMVAFGG